MKILLCLFMLACIVAAWILWGSKPEPQPEDEDDTTTYIDNPRINRFN